MIITWPLEIFSWIVFDDSFDSLIVADVIKTFSAGMIFSILVLKDNVRFLVLERYGSLRETNDI